jgi:hypothetical protein
VSDINEDVTFWQAACDKATLRRAVKVSLIVGTLLCLINQWEAIIAGFVGVNWVKYFLTYLIPFSVSVYSTAASRVDMVKRRIACELEQG